MWKLDIFVLLGLLVFFPASDCSWVPFCTKNGTQEDCPSFCPETCEFDGNGLCDRMCAGPCVCKPGYVIDERIPACVLRSDCPKDVVQQPGTTVITNFNCFSKSKCVDMSHYY